MIKNCSVILVLVLMGIYSAPVKADMNGDQPETPAGMSQPPVAGSPETTHKGVPKLAVEFQREHWDIPNSYSRNLDIFGKYMQKNPGCHAEIVAYADHTGHGPANVELSQKRANAVAHYLEKNYAVSADRLTAKGYGEVSDKEHNDTPAARQADRTAYGTIVNGKS